MAGRGTKNTGSGVKKLDLFIGGELVSPCCDQYFDNLNPDTGAVWQQVAEASIDDVNRAVLNSCEIWNQGYRDSTVSERELWLKRAVEIIERDKDSIIDELCTEAGLPITQANREVESSIKVLYSIVAMATSMNQQKQISDFSGRVVMNIREPVGVCASICFANEPFFTPVRLSAIALMLGNTVVSLFSSLTPNASLRLAMVYREAGFPDGAYNQLSDFGAKIGDFLTMHPMAKAVLFQGAGSIGKRISEVCGLQMKGCLSKLYRATEETCPLYL